jgi:hypothetical protein
MASFVKSWSLRTLIVAVLAAAGYGAWFAYSWVSPEKVRAAVEAQLRERIADSVEVRVGSAHLRLFGGISISELTLTQRGEPEPFLHIPSATITHDKEQLNQGELVIRKIELENPTFRIDRRADGTWNLTGLLKDAGTGDKPLPAHILKNATVIVTDHRPNGSPAIALRNIHGSLLNESLPILKWDGSWEVMSADALDESGQPDPTAMRIRMATSLRWNRNTQQVHARVEIPSLDVSPDLAPVLCRQHPQLLHYAQQFQCKAGVKADVVYKHGAGNPWQYDVKLELKEGRYEDPVLPWPLERLAGNVRLQDGRVTVEKLTGKLGPAAVELNLESKTDLLAAKSNPEATIPGPRLRPPVISNLLRGPLLCYPEYACQDPLQLAEERLERFELVVAGLSLDDELFARLTPKVERIRTMFNPQGGVDVAVKFQRTSDGGWKREVDLRPNHLSIEYEKFRYPVKDLAGSLRKITASDGTDEYRVNMTGTAGGRRIDLTGKVAGEGPDPHISLRIAGTDVPIDEELIAALPGKYSQSVGKLRAKARGDFVVDIRQSFQVNRCENTFRIRVYNGSVNYTHFPYAFRQVNGNVLIKVSATDPSRPLRPGMPIVVEDDTDRVELRGFEAVHDGGRMWLTGDSEGVPGSTDRKLTLKVQGENWPIDDEFRAALKELKLESAIARFAPRGELTFGADVEVWDRSPSNPQPGLAVSTNPGEVAAKLPAEPPFNPTRDLRLALNFKGPTITPNFFAYDLHQLEGVLRYHGGRVELSNFSAKHGPSTLKLEAGEVLFPEGGEVWANLGGIAIQPLVADAAFLKALPGKLRSGFDELNLRGPAELSLKHLVVRVPQGNTTKVRGQAPSADPAEDRWKPLPANAGATTRPYDPVPPGVHLESQSSPTIRFVPITPAAATVTDPAASDKDSKTIKPASRGLLSFHMPWQKQPSPLPPATPALPPKFFPADEPDDPIVYWNAQLKLTGASLDAGLPWDEVHGTIASEGRYEGNSLGTVLGNAWFEKATIAKQPITNGKFTYRVRPQQPDPVKAGEFQAPVVEFPDLSATLFSGIVGGQARVTLGEQPRYRLYLTASDVRLDEVAKQYKLGTASELRGLAQGSILVENVPDPKTGKLVTSGNGHVDVPQGRMYNLPVMLELVKVMKGQTPDGAAFEEAHAVFELKGDRLKVTQLDLLGSAVSLGGSGELDTSGQYVKFEFYTIWSQTLKRWLSSPLGDVTGALSGSLFKIELSRENGKLTPKAHMLPVVTDPVRAVAERLRNRTGKATDATAGKPQP